MENISEELLLYTGKKTGLPLYEIQEILEETIRTIVHLTSLGNTVRMPHGLMGIVLLPETDEFSEVGIGSKLFPAERLVLTVFSKEVKDWGYENIPSGKINRELRKRLGVPKCATKIKIANEAGVLRYYHFESHRECGE